MPADRAGQNTCLLAQLLHVVLAEMGGSQVGRDGGIGGGLVESEDVAGGFEFGDEDEADLSKVSGGDLVEKRWRTGRWGLLMDSMRDTTDLRFSMSCLARCGVNFMSVVIVVAVGFAR